MEPSALPNAPAWRAIEPIQLLESADGASADGASADGASADDA